MAKSKGKAKGKGFDLKGVLLKKGEYIALGVAGFFLVALLLMGVTTWSGAADPAAISKDMTTKADGIKRAITNPNVDVKPDDINILGKDANTYAYKPVKAQDFEKAPPLFDPTGRPDTKRENPRVESIGEYQVDLVRGAMEGYDIIYVNDGKDAQIAVKVVTQLKEQDKEKVKDALGKIQKRGRGGLKSRQQLSANRPQGAAPMGPMGPMGPMSSAGPPLMTGSLGPSPMGYGMFGPMGGTGSDGGAQRSETKILYIPLEDLDSATEKQQLPAMTVIPLRLVVINATFPLKRQMAEVARAMRFKTPEEARDYVRFDGFEVKRRMISPTGLIVGTDKKYADVAKRLPDGNLANPQDFGTVGFFDYKYEDKYIEKIHARKLNDYFEGSDPNPEIQKYAPYLPYFYRYEDALVMPLPELVPDLGGYPPLKLKSINETIQKLRDLNTQKVDPSSLAERLMKKGSRKGIFTPETAQQTQASEVFGGEAFRGPKLDPMKMKAPDPKNPMGGGLENQPNVDIDQLLVRFADPDVAPGFTYEYQIRLRMLNPNYGGSPGTPAAKAAEKYVANPNDAKVQILFSPWTQLSPPLTVPAESFLFAADPGAYREKIDATYGKDQKHLLARLQAKDNQAVVEAVTWLEQVRTENGKREPVGGWVVADMPVARGELIGKKTYLKLPLWSSESNQYVFREVPAAVMKKDKEQPKGWLVDFSTRAVLVDFEGGKVTTRYGGGRSVSEDVGTELLILRPDGRLQVRKSVVDTEDPTRKELTGVWDAWLTKVETRPTPTGGSDGNTFERKQP